MFWSKSGPGAEWLKKLIIKTMMHFGSGFFSMRLYTTLTLKIFTYSLCLKALKYINFQKNFQFSALLCFLASNFDKLS